MRKEDIFIRDCHDIIMKCPCGNGFSRLPYKECSCRIKAVEPRQCLAGLDILARRKWAAAPAMNQDLHARFVMAGAKAHMIGGAFISKGDRNGPMDRSEEHTSELQSLMRPSYAVFCLEKTKHKNTDRHTQETTKTQYKTYVSTPTANS